MDKDMNRILVDEYSKIKKGIGMPFHVLADKCGFELFDLYRELRKIDSKFPLQIEEISFIAENNGKIPRWKIAEIFNLENYHFENLKRSIGISFIEEKNELTINATIKWLIEEELKAELNDELPYKISTASLAKYKLGKLQNHVYQPQKNNKELYPLPSTFILVDLAYPNYYKPWQFRGLKSEYWSHETLGKLRLPEALKWLIQEKKKIPVYLIPNLKRHRTFVTARELQFYHIYKDAFKYQFNTLQEWINYTYPENLEQIVREGSKLLIQKLKTSERITNSCEICGLTENLEIHHIIPLWIGGTNDTFNLMSLCSNHHTEAHKKNFHDIIFRNKISPEQRVDFFRTIYNNK